MELIDARDLPSVGILLSNSYRLRLEKDGKFPRRVHPTPQTTAYVRREILDYNAKLVAERDATSPKAA
jgi:predicted DNA-binding transcriptional regulator AlpA